MDASTHLSVDPTFGALTIGGILSTLIYGSTALQVLHYYRTYFKKDRGLFKVLVLVVFFLDTAQLVFLLYIVYTTAISHWGDVSITLHTANGVGHYFKLLSAHLFITIIYIPCTQCFWAWRFWTIGKTSVRRPLLQVIVLILLVLIVGQFAASFVYAVFGTTRFRNLGSTDLKIWTTPALVTLAITDISIAVSLSYVLKYSACGIPRVDSVLSHLSVYTLANGLLTTTFTVATLVTFLTVPNNWAWMVPFWIQERLYASSLMFSFNKRCTSLQCSDSLHFVSKGSISPGPTSATSTIRTLNALESDLPKEATKTEEVLQV